MTIKELILASMIAGKKDLVNLLQIEGVLEEGNGWDEEAVEGLIYVRPEDVDVLFKEYNEI